MIDGAQENGTNGEMMSLAQAPFKKLVRPQNARCVRAPCNCWAAARALAVNSGSWGRWDGNGVPVLLGALAPLALLGLGSSRFKARAQRSQRCAGLKRVWRQAVCGPKRRNAGSWTLNWVRKLRCRLLAGEWFLLYCAAPPKLRTGIGNHKARNTIKTAYYWASESAGLKRSETNYHDNCGQTNIFPA